MRDSNVIELHLTAEVSLESLLKRGAQELLAKAIESELVDFLSRYAERKTDDGRQAIVRNGYLPERNIQSGLGDIPVKVPKTRDRAGEVLKFNTLKHPIKIQSLTLI